MDRTARRSSFQKLTLVQAAVIALGVVLWMTVAKEWILLAGLGAFVPGMLRELGLLRDLDEFQREASRRAAFHAYLVGGLATAVLITVIHLGGEVPYPADVVTLVLVVLWMTWLFSYLNSFLGPQKTATWLLLAFGAFWLLFAVLDGASGATSIGGAIVGILMHLLFVLPFALGAYAARRWPKPTGWALLVIGAFLVAFLGRPSAQVWTTRLLTLTVLAAPILASGLGLVRMRAAEALAE